MCIEQILGGCEQSSTKPSKYDKCATSIKSIVSDFENRDLEIYLRGIAHNFKLQV